MKHYSTVRERRIIAIPTQPLIEGVTGVYHASALTFVIKHGLKPCALFAVNIDKGDIEQIMHRN